MSNAFAARQWATMKLFEGVSRHKGKVLISLVITTLAMSLLLVAFTLSLTAYNSVKGVSVAQEMTIFTNQGVSSERAANLKETIEKQPGITRVRLVSPDEALGLIGDTDNTDLSFSTNPLPNILLATVSTDIPEKQVDETAKFIEKQPGVDSVAYDSTWNSNIQALKNAFTKFGLLTGGLLCGLILMVLLGSACPDILHRPPGCLAGWICLPARVSRLHCYCGSRDLQHRPCALHGSRAVPSARYVPAAAALLAGCFHCGVIPPGKHSRRINQLPRLPGQNLMRDPSFTSSPHQSVRTEK